MKKIALLLAALCALIFSLCPALHAAEAKTRLINGKTCELKGGRLFIDGEWVFMKSGKPLRDFGSAEGCKNLEEQLPKLKSLGYTNLSLNCYWHHFDFKGDGSISVSLEPLRKLIDAINEQGMFASLSVETYGVGGGQLPKGFFEKHPGAVAVDSEGKEVSDTEYGFGSTVPSLFDENYLKASRAFIKNLCAALSDKDFLYCETTVEPQYMGARALDYSQAAKLAYEKWRGENQISSPKFPAKLPAKKEFVDNKNWNRFRAEHLAEWINGDALAMREGFGNKPVWIAVDYLDANEGTMQARVGIPEIFLENLSQADIIQVNWTWDNEFRKPNLKAYKRVYGAMKKKNRDWVVSEHMTINGSDYRASEMKGLLRNTIENGTGFGWEFVNIAPGGDFSVYDEGWKPKPHMAVVEQNWQKWLEEIRAKHASEKK